MNVFINMLAASDIASSIDRSTPLSERLVLSFNTLVIGLGTVMIVLALLWGILELSGLVFHKIPNKKKQSMQEIVDNNSFESEPEVLETTDSGNENEEDIIAVITAAVAAHIDFENMNLKQEEKIEGFRVVSFKKINRR